MLSTTQLSLIAAISVIAILALAVLAHRAAQKAHAHGYASGHAAAGRIIGARIAALDKDIERLYGDIATIVTVQRQAHEAVMRDAARRSTQNSTPFTKADELILRACASQLLLASETYTALKLPDQARFALQVHNQALALAERLSALPEKNHVHSHASVTARAAA